METNYYQEIIEYAPIVIVLLMFFWQNNVFVRPEQLERKHREILDDIEDKLSQDVKGKYVELSAYREFQSHVLKELEDVNKGINEVKDILINHRG